MRNLVRYKNASSRNLDAFFNDFFNRSLTDFIGNDMAVASTPAINVIEQENEYHIELAAPGMSRENFDIQVERDTVTIKGEQRHNEEENDEKYVRREFNYTAFKRSFNVPTNVNVEEIGAKYQDGVLTLSFPKRVDKKEATRTIEIK